MHSSEVHKLLQKVACRMLAQLSLSSFFCGILVLHITAISVLLNMNFSLLVPLKFLWDLGHYFFFGSMSLLCIPSASKGGKKATEKILLTFPFFICLDPSGPFRCALKPSNSNWPRFCCLFVCFGIFVIIQVTLEADEKSWAWDESTLDGAVILTAVTHRKQRCSERS